MKLEGVVLLLTTAALAGCGWLLVEHGAEPTSAHATTASTHEATTMTTRETTTRQTTTPPAAVTSTTPRPPIDLAVPAGVETATFALG